MSEVTPCRVCCGPWKRDGPAFFTVTYVNRGPLLLKSTEDVSVSAFVSVNLTEVPLLFETFHSRLLSRWAVEKQRERGFSPTPLKAICWVCGTQ